MRYRRTVLLAALLLIGINLSYGQNAKHVNTKKDVAIDGYDPVSYFDNAPKEGSSVNSAKYEGITYFFTSVANKNKFEEKPASYIPEYGGWCAYAMGANGEKVKVDPETYKIVSGKLYLFYNFRFTNTLNSWNDDEKALKGKADTNWQKIIN